MSIEIKSIAREHEGTSASRRLRKTGQVPAVVYGAGTEPKSIALDHKEMFYALEKAAFFTQVLKLDVDGTSYDVIVRDYQMHPVRKQVQHIDFQVVDMSKRLRLRLPIQIINAEKSQAVKLQSGRVSLLSNVVNVLVDPKNIPTHLVLDCENVVAGDILHLSDLVYPEGVQSVSLLRNSNLAVATVTGKKR